VDLHFFHHHCPFHEKRSGRSCLPPPVCLTSFFQHLLVSELCFLAFQLILCLLAFIFFFVLLLYLKHKADAVDNADQESQYKAAAEDVTDKSYYTVCKFHDIYLILSVDCRRQRRYCRHLHWLSG